MTARSGPSAALHAARPALTEDASDATEVGEANHRSAATLLIIYALASAVLVDRAQIKVDTGGRGILPLVDVISPFVALATIVVFGQRRSLGFLHHPAFTFGVLPYLVLTAFLPVLGIMFQGFPVRTLLSLTGATTELSFVIIGAALAMTPTAAWSRWLLVAIVAQLIYGAGQTSYLLHGPGWQLFVPFHQWDLSLVDIQTFVQARSTGLYLNPNELGLWAAAAAVFGWSLLSGRVRNVGITLAFLTLLLSQSRGVLVALLVVCAASVAIWLVRGRIAADSVRAGVSLVAALVVAFIIAIVIAPPGALETRFGALLEILSKGPRADQNLAGRLDYWSAVADLNVSHPLGTWGSPELILGTAIDSSWFRAFAQGSVFSVAALVLLLAAAVTLRDFPQRNPLRLLTVLIAIAGITQTPFSYPVIAIFWVFLGSGLQLTVGPLAVPGRPRPPGVFGTLPTRSGGNRT